MTAMATKRKKKHKFDRVTQGMRWKMSSVFLLICLAMFCLAARVACIQYENKDEYQKMVLAQQGYGGSTIPFQRGNITDCNGTILATSVDVYNVVLDCKVINSKAAYKEATIQALVKCFPQLDAATLEKEITDRKDSQYYVVAKKLPYEETRKFLKIQKNTKKHPNVQGVWFEKEYERNYPMKSLASTIIGFTTSGNEGINGLESYYNDVLNGTDGRQYGYLNQQNDYEQRVIDATDGQSLVTTIDANIQSIVEKKILEYNEQYRDNFREGAGSENTAVIVADPKNGEILAMAEYPTYDLSDPRDLTAYYSQEAIDAMTEDEKYDILNKLWQNYCITNSYEPGSTAKLFTVAAALETGSVHPDEKFICDGFQQVGNRQIHCVNRGGHGEETIQQAIMNSCNDVMMQLVERMGPKNFIDYQTIFNIGLKTGIDLPGEVKTADQIYTENTMNATALATNSFGQNFNVTMIEMVAAYNSILNGGSYYRPHVVKKILDSEGNTLKTVEPVKVRETISKETGEYLKQYLQATVSEGTAKAAKVEGYSMGGKTGTAETYPRKNEQYLVSFIGYVPANDPQVLVYSVINRPNVEDQAHSTYAQILTKNVLEEILPYMNIYPDETEDPDAKEKGAEDLPEANGQTPSARPKPDEDNVQDPQQSPEPVHGDTARENQ